MIENLNKLEEITQYLGPILCFSETKDWIVGQCIVGTYHGCSTAH